MDLEQRISLILKLGFDEKSLPALRSYIDLLWKSNEELNLISRKMNFSDLIDNHVIDSLLPLPQFPSELRKVADFGSGGGLPGVIFALQFPRVEFHLFEKSPKKQDFLKKCQEMAPNIQIHSEIPANFSGYDLVTARAFKPIDVTLELSRKYFNSGGKYFLLKGRREKIEEEIQLAQKKFKSLENHQLKIVPLLSPILDVQRHLVLIN